MMVAGLIAGILRIFTGARARGAAEAWAGGGPRVFFANHTSNLDFVALWSVLPPDLRSRTRPVAARDYWTGGPVRRWLAERVFRAVLIERRQVTRANNPLEQMLPVLEAGECLILFPEGGRFEGGEPAPFKSGLFHLAERCPEARLVPVYIENLNRVLPKGEVLAVPVLCSVNFGESMRPGEGETREAFLERARGAVRALGPAAEGADR
jgi:1-acyl-sn-glycerol-3-phosphate acyltransferase